MASVDSCNQSCVGKHRDTESFSVFCYCVCVCVNSYCSITPWRLWCSRQLFVQQFSETGRLHRHEVTPRMSHFYHQGLEKRPFLRLQKHHLTSCLHLSQCRPTAVAEPFSDVTFRLQLDASVAVVKVSEAFCCTKSCPPRSSLLRSALKPNPVAIRTTPASFNSDGKQENSLYFSLSLRCTWPLLFVRLCCVCLHVNSINTLLPSMQCLVSLVLDDGTKTLSSNR